jgi:hypothetical protein
VYDVTPGQSGFDTSAKTIWEIEEHIACTIDHVGYFHTAMKPDSFGFSSLFAPSDPSPTAMVAEIQRWKLEIKKQSNTVHCCESAEVQAFAIVLGQCSPTTVDCLKSNEDWDTISENNDLIALLHLFQTSMYLGLLPKHCALTD